MGRQWKQKGREQAADARGRIFSKLAKEISIAARAGADPDMNPRLRMAVEAAKKASMTRETLERAIKKGAGLLDEKANYELVAYEGFAPHQVAVIVECLTDNRARTATSVRTLFRKGQLGVSGSVSWDFKREGIIEADPPAGADPESAAIEAGAQDSRAGRGGRDPLLHRARRFSTASPRLWRRRAGRSRPPSPAGARRTRSRSTKRPAGRPRPSCKSSTPTMTCRRLTPRSLEPKRARGRAWPARARLRQAGGVARPRAARLDQIRRARAGSVMQCP